MTLDDHFFLEEIIRYFSFDNQKKNICVAVSGGVDSMVLLNLLLNVPNITLSVAHCNFTLRDQESNEDEIFVRNFCVRKHILCHIKRFNTLDFSKKRKLSIQMAARKLRYDWFEELLKYYEYIALGHHLNDSIETFFINMMRGTGIKGLLGIPRKKRKFIRPLSNFTKKEILHYAQIKNIKWRLDSTNKNEKYIRNKIRLVSSTFSDLFYKGFKKSIEYLNQENSFIEKEIQRIHQEITVEKKNNPFLWKIECKKIKNLQPLSFYLFKFFFPYGFCDIKNLKHLLHAQSGKQLLSKKYRIVKNRDYWILVEKKFLEAKNKKVHIIQNIKFCCIMDFLPIRIEFFLDPKKENYKNMSFIDFDKIQFPLQLRTWRKGDFFFPLNMKGKKKLSKYYKDKKFSFLEKEQTWLLVNGNGNIILVIGNRLDDRFKITEKTKRILGVKI
ncbi:MAG: tRNA lysidine(34) synthetase TilS [Flavobacteriales bacterium]|jgi:tRNA(Ile)-lysidine synthase|uniref:tRNA lysidine(34) synthetase TilS n=1 Tax=Blattabacterium sp. (Mastotermes darwiniensis) TaxID=39768 RepID=UPI000231DFBE|nr:tRNA lysidine(34) synthetase TilS [Blattabacterium sp. (Mastotermes darwiniensis)]AER40470.1 putative tRNA(Ile)-lysidine synthetase [Blattabacterium sp. (Mastotermes darwiniensis) str. MADAR]MDR1805014.1 tRNA lysidine(34) synthetase TilS [Flavobacteriales bacterium]